MDGAHGTPHASAVGRRLSIAIRPGGGLLLTHGHALVNLKEEFLAEVTHVPLGILGALAGWARWPGVRLPDADGVPGWLWRACLGAVGLLLLAYRAG